MAERASGDLEVALQGLGSGDSAEYRPLLFDLGKERERRRLSELLAHRGSSLTKRDELTSQVRELIKARRPGERLSPDALDAAAEKFLGDRGRAEYGTWVYFPWRRELVRVLAEAEFVELRTNRNRYQITPDEQARLAGKRLGIVGLSAGHAIAVCLALERVGSKFRLADHDRVELGNMNRVTYGVSGLGLNKAVQTARQLYEIDPYLDVVPFVQGIRDDNVRSFLADDGGIDLLVEECDDLYMKVRLREEAKALRIPVVMETNDRGLLDIERFDLEPSRPVFHGRLEGTRSDELKNLDTEGKVPFMFKILGVDMSARLGASLVEVEKTITGWPQLASGNMLGGALVTDTARRLLLGEPVASGRYRVDFEDLVEGGQAKVETEVSESVSGDLGPHSSSPEPPAATSTSPSRAEVLWLARLMHTAPSGGNAQPWRFVWHGGHELDGHLDRERSGSFLDFECAGSYLALGAAAENAWVAATALGRPVEVTLFPDQGQTDLVFRLTLGARADGTQKSPLVPYIDSRVTNRREGKRRPLDGEHHRVLTHAARDRDAALALVTDPEALSEVGDLLGGVDRFRFLCEALYVPMMDELRWTNEEVASGDGIDVATLDLDALGMAGLRLLSKPKIAAFLRSLGQGLGLETSARRAVDAASAVGLITVDGEDAAAYFRAGRAMQQVWLWATKLGVAVQPMSVAPYLFARLGRGRGAGFTPNEVEILTRLRERFARVFPTVPGRAEAMLFRLSYARAPSARALRRPIESVFHED